MRKKRGGSGRMGETPTGALCRVVEWVGQRQWQGGGGVGQKLRVDFTDLIVWQLPKGRAKERGRYSEREAYREEERKI